MRLHIPFLLSLNAFLGVRAFTTTPSTPTQCGSFTVNWTGGQPPFVLEILPVFGTQRVFNIPAAAFSNGVGSYSTLLQLPQEHQFLVTMSDATGFATGGISPLLTVQPQTSQSSNCNTTDPSPQFFFSNDPALQQCQPYTFNQYDGAVLPVTIYVLVPGGTAIVLNAPNGATEYVWNPASIAAGTTVLFAMSDAQNRTGGVSQIMVAGSTTDTSCLNANSPSVTQQSTQTPLSTSSSSASSNPSATASGSSKISITTLIAAIAGGLIFLGVLAALGAFIFRRRRKSSRRRTANFEVDGGYQDSPSHIPAHVGAVDYFPTHPATGAPYEMPRLENSIARLNNHPSPVATTPYEMSRMENSVSRLIPHPSPVATTDSSSTPSSASSKRKSNMKTSTRHQPAQYILHSDAEEVAPNEAGFIELPPQYSESLRPMPTYGSSGNRASSSIQSSYTP
jgi:hypothetical protein